MRIPIIASEQLNDYLDILNDYKFEPTEYWEFKIGKYDNPISKGTIEINRLEDLFDISERLRKYYKTKRCKDDDLIIIRYVGFEYLLEIYDGYRE